jgi:hypothetical protein
MNFVETYAQLFAIALPALSIVGLNLFLAWGGERGTLLLPIAGRFETRLQSQRDTGVPASRPAQSPGAPANQPDYRQTA